MACSVQICKVRANPFFPILLLHHHHISQLVQEEHLLYGFNLLQFLHFLLHGFNMRLSCPSQLLLLRGIQGVHIQSMHYEL